MTINRRSHFSFVKPEKETRKAFCQKCEEIRGVENRLVPRILDDNSVDDKFKECSYCGDIVPIYDVMLLTEYEPKAQVTDNPFESGTKVTTPIHNRQIKKQVSRIKGFDNDFEPTDFAGKPDELLVDAIERGSIILSNSDSNEDDEE